MGSFGFPQQQQDDPNDAIAQLLQQLAMQQSQGPMSEQIPGGGSSTQMPPQAAPAQMPRYPNAPQRPASANPQEVPDASMPQVPFQGTYGTASSPPPAQSKWGQALQGMGNAISFNSMTPDMQLEARKADMIARIREQELAGADADRQQQLRMEQARLDETKHHNDIMATAMYGAQGLKGSATGDPVKDTYLEKAAQGMSPAQIIADPTYQQVVSAKQRMDAAGKPDNNLQTWLQTQEDINGGPLTPVQKSAAIQKFQTMAPIAGANVRVIGMQESRGANVIDPDTGNAIELTMKQVSDAAKAGHPYINANTGQKLGIIISRLNDIKQATKSVESNVGVLDKEGGADLAAGLADPSMTVTKFLQGQARRPMSDQQKQFVADVFSLREQAMGVRSLMGAGQGAEDVRNAIQQTLPGIASGDSNMAKKQVVNMYKMLDRVKAGVPKLPGAWGAGMETTGAQPASAAPPTPSAKPHKTYKGADYEQGDDGQWHKIKQQ